MSTEQNAIEITAQILGKNMPGVLTGVIYHLAIQIVSALVEVEIIEGD